MDTGEILDLFSMGETADGVAERPVADTSAAAFDSTNELDMVDIDGQVREKGKKGLLDGLDDLWEQSQYDEAYNLDGFLKTMKA